MSISYYVHRYSKKKINVSENPIGNKSDSDVKLSSEPGGNPNVLLFMAL